jgi:hypothetical protein
MKFPNDQYPSAHPSVTLKLSASFIFPIVCFFSIIVTSDELDYYGKVYFNN